jgi:hypothetical protein
MANTDSWNNTAGGNWSNGAKWTTGVPASGQDIYITNSFAGSQAITFDSGAGLTYNSLFVYDNGGGTNNISMPGNNLTVANEELIDGAFNQTGGTNNGGTLAVSGPAGTYTLGSGATLLASVEIVDYASNFNQTGGNNTITGAMLYVGQYSTGNYTLASGASLLASNSSEVVGYSGLGNFNQTGGTNTITNGQLALGYGYGGNADATGTYTLGSGASLLASNSYEEFGFAGVGNFNQTGGSNTITSAGLIVGYGGTNGISGTGNYILGSGATLLASNSYEQIGFRGVGNFNQTGGSNTITGQELDLAVNSGAGTYTLSGGTLNAPKAYVGGSSTGAGGIGIFNVSGSGTFSIASTLQIFGTGSMTINGSIANGALDSAGNLNVAPGGLLNLNSSALTINYGSNSSPNAVIRNYISSAYNVNGTLWTGTTGITSSVAAANPGHSSIGFADGADGVVTNLPAGISSAIPGGGHLPAGSELVTSAFPGDGNLDGKVDFNDFVLISTHFLQSDINWDHGNYNYDGVVDFNDFVVLSTNFGEGVTGGDGTGATAAELAQFNAMATGYGISTSQVAAWDATIANLPEPASTGLLTVGALGLLRRRRNSSAK